MIMYDSILDPLKIPTGCANPDPRVVITEQPSQVPVRFRYACEGSCAGPVIGVRSSRKQKTYPTVKIENYEGQAKIVVSCVNSEEPFSPHPHNLVGKNCLNGVCEVITKSAETSFTFFNLGIQCVRKCDIKESLKIREQLNVDPYKTGYSEKVQMNSLRLCFQVYLKDKRTKKFTHSLRPVVSNIIYDKRTNKDLVICKLSHCSASVDGGKQIILLCEKVSKGDIRVKFFELKNNVEVWKGYGIFVESDVHKQVAITFRTPKYISNVKKTGIIQVWVQLEKISDSSVGEALPFEFSPSEIDVEELKHKRQRLSCVNDLKSPFHDMASFDPLAQPSYYIHNNFETLDKPKVYENRPHVNNGIDNNVRNASIQHHNVTNTYNLFDQLMRVQQSSICQISKFPEYKISDIITDERLAEEPQLNLAEIIFSPSVNYNNAEEEILSDSLNRLKIKAIDEIISMTNNLD